MPKQMNSWQLFLFKRETNVHLDNFFGKENLDKFVTITWKGFVFRNITNLDQKTDEYEKESWIKNCEYIFYINQTNLFLYKREKFIWTFSENLDGFRSFQKTRIL